ncbi:MAG: FAD-binding oxidoreductase [Balneolaceae bacterium]|nr:FAD-binding oxidoreductase [Balneolaceae bacterium]
MPHSTSFDFVILGAGLAGLSLADSLAERGQSVCVVEAYEIGAGASGTPLGMVNPATGRRATKTWRAEQCYRAISENLQKVAPYSDATFFRQNGVLRPALTEKIARKMSSQLEKTTWPPDWIHWLTEEEIKAKHPGITCVNGGLWLPIGITVDVTRYLQALASYLSETSTIIEDADIELEQTGRNWRLYTEHYTINATNLIFATGYSMVNHPWWNFLPLHPIKGQLAVFEPDEPLSFDHSISSLGYIATLSNNRFAQGSTYEHDFDDLETDDYGEEYLRNKLKRTLPELESRAKLVDQWAGVRISTPNRKPVLGKHPDRDNLYTYTGLGSKGLMYGKFLANHYTDYLLNNKPLFEEVNIQRFEES